MTTITNGSLAAGTGVSVKNTQFKATVEDLQRKAVIIATYDPAKVGIADNIPEQFLNATAIGAKYGKGTMIHRLAIRVFKGSKNGTGVEVYVIPQPELGGSVAATGQVAFTAAGVLAGTVYLYAAGLRIPFTIATGATDEEITDAAIAAITADQNLPITASKVAITFELKIDSKSAGPWGNDISISFNLGTGEEFPTGVSQVTTPMATGAGIPDIDDALNGTGIGDNANEAHYTGIVHGYGLDTTTLDKISTYVGEGNVDNGLYSKVIARPFRALTGDVTPLDAGLTALIAISDTRLEDRANGVIYTPDSKSHPSEIAALALGKIETINSSIAAMGYNGQPLEDINPGISANRPTDQYTERDRATEKGISATSVQGGVVTLENVITFYRPDDVDPNSNGYRDMSNISTIQNILNSEKKKFQQEKWKGTIIVKDKSVVTGVNKIKAVDTGSVRDDMFALADAWAEKGWIFDAEFMKNKLKEPGAITIRTAGNGFNVINGFQLSGNGDIIDIVNNFDISIS